MAVYDYLFLLHSDTAIGQSGSEATTNEINFGVANPNIGASGQAVMTVHVTQAFTSLTGAYITLFHGAATSPTTTLISRYLSSTQLGLLKKYILPIPPTNLQYVKGYFQVVGSNPGAGKITAYIGVINQGGL
jgi:hypothetical protein